MAQDEALETLHGQRPAVKTVEEEPNLRNLEQTPMKVKE